MKLTALPLLSVNYTFALRPPSADVRDDAIDVRCRCFMGGVWLEEPLRLATEFEGFADVRGRAPTNQLSNASKNSALPAVASPAVPAPPSLRTWPATARCVSTTGLPPGCVAVAAFARRRAFTLSVSESASETNGTLLEVELFLNGTPVPARIIHEEKKFSRLWLNIIFAALLVATFSLVVAVCVYFRLKVQRESQQGKAADIRRRQEQYTGVTFA